MLLELVPDAGTSGYFVLFSEVNSEYQAKMFGEELEKDGISYKEYTGRFNEIQSVVVSMR